MIEINLIKDTPNLSFLDIGYKKVLLYSALVILMASLGSLATRQQSIEQDYWDEMATVEIEIPQGTPPITQESIDLAMLLFNIKQPENATYPQLDQSLKDRGLTVKRFSNAHVFIGPSAFSSWSMLGSTLAHELEVHCEQNFILISILDKIGLNGTVHAERMAYVHELRNARRFGTNSTDYAMISDTMDFYYPLDFSDPKPMALVKTWFARLLY